jgi:hypothetical protein
MKRGSHDPSAVMAMLFAVHLAGNLVATLSLCQAPGNGSDEADSTICLGPLERSGPATDRGLPCNVQDFHVFWHG